MAHFKWGIFERGTFLRAILKDAFLMVRFSGVEIVVLNVYLNNESCGACKNTGAAGSVCTRTGESVLFCKTKYKNAPTGIVPVGAYAVRGIVL